MVAKPEKYTVDPADLLHNLPGMMVPTGTIITIEQPNGQSSRYVCRAEGDWSDWKPMGGGWSCSSPTTFWDPID